MAYCYIIYSPKLDRFYTGSTELDPEVRLEFHISKRYGNKKFTAAADDWNIFTTLQCTSIAHARKVETHIKKMKSKEFIKNLKKYPELKEKLIMKSTPGSPR